MYASKVVAEDLYSDIAYHVDVVKRGARADEFSPHRQFHPDERRRLGMLMKDYYWNVFVQKVSDGRGLSPQTVDDLGRGRIWSGIDAHSFGLVDTLGGFRIAKEELASLLGWGRETELELVHVPKPRSLFSRMVNMMIRESPPSGNKIVADIRTHAGLGSHDRIQMRMPIDIDVK